MRIAVLYRKPRQCDQGYSKDSDGRGGIKHILRVKDILQALGHEAEIMDVNLETYENLKKAGLDLVFNLCDDGFRNNSLLEPHVPAMLDILEIPYTGSNFFTLAAAVNKARAKEMLSFHGIPTPKFQVFSSSQTRRESWLHLPLIVKPLHEDASIGLRRGSVVKNSAQLKKRIDFIIKNYHQPALVEEFIDGREAYVAILGPSDEPLPLAVSEVMFDPALSPTARICSYKAKWAPESKAYHSTPVQCPASLDKTLEEKLIALAKQAYAILECQDYGRVDFRIDQDNQPYVLEVNPNPDISEGAGLAKMARVSGINYEQLIAKILSFALSRNHS